MTADKKSYLFSTLHIFRKYKYNVVCNVHIEEKKRNMYVDKSILFIFLDIHFREQYLYHVRLYHI